VTGLLLEENIVAMTMIASFCSINSLLLRCWSSEASFAIACDDIIMYVRYDVIDGQS
jgi:hypothetical protein